MQRANTPTALRMVVNDKEHQELRLVWADGHISRMPWVYLRSWAPDVISIGGHGAKKAFHFRGQEPRRCEVVGWQRQGNYALLLVYADGHDTAIYPFEFLRGLDPTLSEGEPDSYFSQTPDEFKPLAYSSIATAKPDRTVN
jgi:DUF971 family protein